MEETGVSATALEALEKDFQNVMQELGGEDNLERFRLEYEKLHRALKKSHESEKRLIKKCQELSQEIVSNGVKIQSAIKLSQGDQSTIEALKKEIERAWKMVDAANEKETRAKDMIQSLKKETTNLLQIVDQGTSLTQGHEMTLAQLTEEKRQLLREQNDLSHRVTSLTTDNSDIVEKAKRVELDTATKQELSKSLVEKAGIMKKEYERESKSFDRAEGQCRELTNVLQIRTNELEVRSKAITKYEEVIANLNAQITKNKQGATKHATNLQRQTQQLQETKKSHEDFAETMQSLTAQIQDLEIETKHKEARIVAGRHEEQKLQKRKDQAGKEMRRMVQLNEDIKKQYEMFVRQEKTLAKQVDSMTKDLGVLEGDLKREDQRQLQLTKVVEAEKAKQGKVHEGIKIENMKQDELQAAIEKERAIGVKLKSTIVDLENDRERFAEEASEVNTKCSKASEEVKVGLMRVEDLQKQIEDAAKRLSEQQHLYEQVRSDRNLYSKKLIEAQDEISELKQKFKIMDHQIDQLKEELGMKEKKYFEEQARQKTDKEKLMKIRKQANEYITKFDVVKKRSEALNQEIKQLTKVINQCDAELSAQQQQFLTATNERDILGTQLIRRNDELALLYEKLRIQQQTANKGEVQYRDRLIDIRMLRLKINELRSSIHTAQVRVKNIDDIRTHIITLQRQLTLERTKVQALSEELENPQNYLRWRRLEGEDLKEDEMANKIQSLQKRLIAKTEESVEKDIVISEMDKLYVELRAILARQPGPEVAEQLNAYQQELRSKNASMKSMASELNMSSTQISEAKYEIERLSRELQEVKKMYFDMRISNQLHVTNAERTWAGGSVGQRSTAAMGGGGNAPDVRMNQTM